MLFKILKLFGLDVRAEVAAVKNQIDQRVEDIADRAKHAAISSALIIALSTFAGLFLTMAIGVGLIALHTEAETYSVDLALGIVAAVLVVATLILIIAAWLLGRSLSNKPSSELPQELQDDVKTRAVVPAAPPVPVPVPAAFESEPVDSAGDFMEPRLPTGEIRQIPGTWSSGAGLARGELAGHFARDRGGGGRAGGQSRATRRQGTAVPHPRRCGGRRMDACATKPR